MIGHWSLEQPITCWPARPDSAVSPEAHAVREQVEAAVRTLERSQALFGRKAAVIGQIWGLVNECAEQGWDGEDAEPLASAAASTAQQFVKTLPIHVPLPEITPDPDGSISLEWIVSRNRLFSLSVGTSNRLAFAWVDGSDRGHGVVRYDGETIPARILQGIDDTMKHANPALGPS